MTAFVMPNEMHWKEGGMAPQRAFDPHPFLAKVSTGRTVVAYQEQRPIFSQGEAADAVFYWRRPRRSPIAR